MSLRTTEKQTRLILASGSPRRRELLALLGLPFAVLPADVEEHNHAGENAAQMVLRLSQDKAHAGLALAQGHVIVAADTTVALDEQVVGKPTDPTDAVRILRSLRGRQHTVFSGLTVIDGPSGAAHSEVAASTVWMRDYGDAEIAAYVASGDPMDKAGAYAIQYHDFAPVAQIVGCYSNVMGLPICHVYRILHHMGLAPHQTPVLACDRHNRRHCVVAQEILAGS